MFKRVAHDFHAHPLVLFKRAICTLRLAGVFGLIEFCHRCGRRVHDVWWAPPLLWYEVMGVGDAGCRCVSCFSLECQERGIAVVWHPLVERRRDAAGRWSEVPPPAPEFYPIAARLHAERQAAE